MWNPASWTPAPGAQARAALARLDRAQHRLLDAMVFDGASCADVARAIGSSELEVRREVGAAMCALAAQLIPDRDHDGAVAAMFALRALDALDRDEIELIDAMLVHQPALQRRYAAYEALAGELCALVPQIAASPRTLARLSDTIDREVRSADERDENRPQLTRVV